MKLQALEDEAGITHKAITRHINELLNVLTVEDICEIYEEVHR